jgi:hypothetical protein
MQRYLSTALAATAVTVSMVAGFALPAAASPAAPANGSGSKSGAVRAAATAKCLRDPRGDEVDDNGQPVNQPKADLVAACAHDNGRTITLRAVTAVLSNPLTDPAWKSSTGGTGPTWMLSSNADGSGDPVGFVNLANDGGRLIAQVASFQGSTSADSGAIAPTRCHASAAFAATGPNAGYTVSFPASCLGGVGRLYWSVSMAYDPPGDSDGSQLVSDQLPNNEPYPEMDGFPVTQGYWLIGADGGVFAFGSAPFEGSEGGRSLTSRVVAAAATPDGRGYYLAAANGAVFAHGDAVLRGAASSLRLTSPVVAIAVTPDGGGYLLILADGGVLNYGDAPALGSIAGLALAAPIVAGAVTPDNAGYWLFAADGGVFAFGDANYYGSLGALHLNRPIVGAAIDPSTGGYWLVGADGGVFAFHAPFLGSTGAVRLAQPVVGLASTRNGTGYRLVARDGGVFDFGTAAFQGSEGGQHLNSPIVATASVQS